MYLDQREILVSLTGRPDLSDNGVSCLQGIGLNLILRDIYIVRRVEIVIVRRTEESVTVRHDLQYALSFYDTVILRFLRLWSGSRLRYGGGQLFRCLMLRQLMPWTLMRRKLGLGLLLSGLGLRTCLSLSFRCRRSLLCRLCRHLIRRCGLHLLSLDAYTLAAATVPTLMGFRRILSHGCLSSLFLIFREQCLLLHFRSLLLLLRCFGGLRCLLCGCRLGSWIFPGTVALTLGLRLCRSRLGLAFRFRSGVGRTDGA